MATADMIHRGFFAETATRVSQLRAREELIAQSLSSKLSKNTAIKDIKQKKLSKNTKSRLEVSSNGKKNIKLIADVDRILLNSKLSKQCNFQILQNNYNSFLIKQKNSLHINQTRR